MFVLNFRRRSRKNLLFGLGLFLASLCFGIRFFRCFCRLLFVCVRAAFTMGESESTSTLGYPCAVTVTATAPLKNRIDKTTIVTPSLIER